MGRKWKRWAPVIVSAVAAVSAAQGCGDDGGLVIDPAVVTDPYCVETENWFEDLSVTAAYSVDEPEFVVVTIEPTHDLVTMNGLMDFSQADAYLDSLVFDGRSLILVLRPLEDAQEISLTGAVDCTTETQPLALTLYLSPDDQEVTFELTYIDDTPDAGADAGDVSQTGV